jgi:hypothetical protein
LNLSTLRLLGPHLDQDNHERLLAMAKGRGKREVEELVARIAPRPDVSSSIRRLPGPPRPSIALRALAAPESEAVTVHGCSLVAGESRSTPAPSADVRSPALGEPASAAPAERPECAQGPRTAAPLRGSARPQSDIAPLAPERYRIQLTVGRETHDRLRRLQDLLRRELPDGDPAAIFDRALTALEDKVRRTRQAATSSPRPARDGSVRSRHVPASVKRAVWRRDGGRCAFVAASGRRCCERAFLEIHHQEPFGAGGETSAANLSLRCRPHNVHEAERVFGRWSPGPPPRERAARLQARDSAAGRPGASDPKRPISPSAPAPGAGRTDERVAADLQ